MKKVLSFILQLALVIQCGTVCFADNVDVGYDENKPDYSLMGGGILNMPVVGNEISLFSTEDFDVVPESNKLSGNSSSNYEKIYNVLSNAITPDNIQNLNSDNIIYYTDTKTQKTGAYLDLSGVCFYYNYNEETDGELKAFVETKIPEISKVYNDFWADNPELFFLSNGFLYGSYTTESTAVIQMLPGLYTDYQRKLVGQTTAVNAGNSADLVNFIKTGYNQLTSKIEEIGNELRFDGMTDYDKLLVAHDYITDNCAYYRTTDANGKLYYGDSFSYNAYGVLMLNQAVCQGYALAYKAILKELGYGSENIFSVSSEKLNHMWSFIKLNGKWYHIDTTWDDPIVINSLGEYNKDDLSMQRTYHEYFLLSNSSNTEIREKDTFDMTLLGKNAYSYSPSMATDISYESGFVYNIGKGFDGLIKHDNLGYVIYPHFTVDINRYPVKYNFRINSLKATDYIVSQPFLTGDNPKFITNLNDLSKGSAIIFNCTADGANPKTVDIYYAFYSDTDKLISVEKTSRTFSGFPHVIGSFPTVPDGAAQVKMMFLSDLSPIANTPILTSAQ